MRPPGDLRFARANLGGNPNDPKGCNLPTMKDLDLVGLTDIRERLAVSKSYAGALGNGALHFPEPIGVIGGRIKVWNWEDVARWRDDVWPAYRRRRRTTTTAPAMGGTAGGRG